MIDAARLLEVHCRLAEGDPIASTELFELVYGPLIGHALKKYRKSGVDKEAAENFALEVLAGLIEKPGTFDPTKSNSLFGFLCMALDGDVMNAFRKYNSRREKFEAHPVELEGFSGNSYGEVPDRALDAERLIDRFGAEIMIDDGDAEVLKLMLKDERETDAYARALGIAGLPEKERAAEVKKRKDRIEVRMKRVGTRLK